MQLTPRGRRQESAESPGRLNMHQAHEVSPGMSFLEMLDEVIGAPIESGEGPIASDHDCSEGMWSATLNGVSHGLDRGVTTRRLHLRSSQARDPIAIGPRRAAALPVIRAVAVDRGASGRIEQAGGFVSANTCAAPDASLTPVPKARAGTAFDASRPEGVSADCIAEMNADCFLAVLKVT